MKKVEWINIIMRYINNRAHFTISELMREFNISRSTTIRDIREIGAMGVPLIAEVGRDGGQGNTLIIDNGGHQITFDLSTYSFGS